MKKCEKCGKSYNDDIKFCPECGVQLKETEAIKGGKTKAIIPLCAVAVVAVIVVVAVCLSMNKSKKRSDTAKEKISVTETKERATKEAKEETNETTEKTTEAKQTTEATTEEKVDLNEESMNAYQEFLDGKITAIVMDNGEFDENDEHALLSPNEEVNLSQLDALYKERYLTEDRVRRSKRYYSYVDFACDGINELGILYSTEEYLEYSSSDDGYDECCRDAVYLKYIDGVLYIITHEWSAEMDGETSVDYIGQKYLNWIISYETFFDAGGMPHDIYTCSDYNAASVTDHRIDSVESTMENEFGKYVNEYIGMYQINGQNYYIDWGNEYVLEQDEWTRYNELLDENGLHMYTDEEIEKIIRLEEQKYVTNGLPDTVPEIDWIEF